jgi:hypothetical protein
MRSTFGWILATAAMIVVLSGCGKGTPPPPLPQPAPPPQTNPNPYGGGFGGGAVNCGGQIGQYPFSQSPLYGNMSYGGSISLTLGYQGFFNGTSDYQSVIGSALLNLPELAQQTNPYQQSPQQIPTQFCVTSSPANGGQPFPGTYVPSDRSVAIVLYGFIQSPIYTYNPYAPYSNTYQQGGGQFTQLPVTVSIGQSIDSYGYSACNAWLYQGRVMGCVQVKIGNNGQVRTYNAQ